MATNKLEFPDILMDEAGFDRAIVLLFGKFRYHCCNEDDRLGMIPAVFIPSLEIDGGYTHCTFAERLRIEKLALFKRQDVYAMFMLCILI